MFDLNVTQLAAIGVALLALVYMFKDSVLSMISKIGIKSKSSITSASQDETRSIKELLDFRSRYAKGSLVHSKLTEVIEALLNKDE